MNWFIKENIFYSTNYLCRSYLDEDESAQYLLCDWLHLIRPHTTIYRHSSLSIFRFSGNIIMSKFRSGSKPMTRALASRIQEII